MILLSCIREFYLRCKSTKIFFILPIFNHLTLVLTCKFIHFIRLYIFFVQKTHIFQHNGIIPVAWYEAVVVHLQAGSYLRHLAHLVVEVFDGTRSVLTHHQSSDAVVGGVASAVIILHVVFWRRSSLRREVRYSISTRTRVTCS